MVIVLQRGRRVVICHLDLEWEVATAFLWRARTLPTERILGNSS